MRRIKRINHYNLHLGEINIKSSSCTTGAFQFIENLQIKGLSFAIGYDDSLLEGEYIDGQIIGQAFTNETNQESDSITEFYNYLRFWQYMDPESIQKFGVIERVNLLLEDLGDRINFSDISDAVKSFKMNK